MPVYTKHYIQQDVTLLEVRSLWSSKTRGIQMKGYLHCKLPAGKKNAVHMLNTLVKAPGDQHKQR